MASPQIKTLPSNPASLTKEVLKREGLIQAMKAKGKRVALQVIERWIDPTVRTTESTAAAYGVGLMRGYWGTVGPKGIPRGLLLGAAAKVAGYVASALDADPVAKHLHAPGDGALSAEAAFLGTSHGFRMNPANQKIPGT